MAVRDQGWHNLNATRHYPFDDGASLVDDDGDQAPTDILVGCSIAFPESAGRWAYVGAMSVTSSVATLIILVSDSLDGSGSSPLLSLNVPRSTTRHRALQLDPLLDGAGGWVTLGPGLDNRVGYRGRFSGPGQSRLLPRAVRRYATPAIPWIATSSGGPRTGLIRLSAGNDLEIVGACVEIPGAEVDVFHPQYCGPASRRAALIRLKDTSTAQNRDVFEVYKGPCGGRPDSRSCGEPQPIEFLGPVAPDCDGRITIELRGCATLSKVVTATFLDELGEVVSSDLACGVVIDCGQGLSDVCATGDRLPDADGRLPNEYDDLCASYSFDSVSTPAETPPVFEYDPVALSENSDPGLPLDVPLSSPDPVVWLLRHGNFTWDKLTTGDVRLSGHDPSSRNIVTYQPTPAGYYRKVSTRMMLLHRGAQSLHNGGLVLNYRADIAGRGPSYILVHVDWDGEGVGFKSLQVSLFTRGGLSRRSIVETPHLRLDADYLLSASVFPHLGDATGAWVSVELQDLGIPDFDVTLGPVHAPLYREGEDWGVFGLSTDRALTRFRDFTIDNVTPP